MFLIKIKGNCSKPIRLMASTKTPTTDEGDEDDDGDDDNFSARSGTKTAVTLRELLLQNKTKGEVEELKNAPNGKTIKR